MRLPKFEYLQPTDLYEALDFLERYRGEAKLIAGGTDILLTMKNRELTPKYLISLNQIPQLDYIRFENGFLKIGSRCTIRTIEVHPVIKEQWGILAQAAKSIGTVQIRYQGTVGGNICNGAPSADTAPSLIALGSKVVLVSKTGERIIPLEEFFEGPGKTNLKEFEILKEIQVPKRPPHSGGVYLKCSRRKAVDLAIVGVAGLITINKENNYCTDARIVLGAVAPIPLRIRKAEEVLTKRIIDDGSLEEAAQIAMDESRPISDVRSSMEYRKEMVKVFTRRVLKESIFLAKSA